MNYRANQLRQIQKNTIAKLEADWAQERAQFQQDIFNLQNSTDAKIIENLEQDLKKKQDLLNQTINLLGPEEIKSLADLENLLKGKTLKELKQSHSQELQSTEKDFQAKIANRNQEINNLTRHLDNLKEKLTFYTENLKTKEEIITEYQKEVKEKDQALQTKTDLYQQLGEVKEKTEAELSQQLTLTQGKINSLETNLLNLAKQKLTNQKQAKILVENLQKEWTQKQEQWHQQNQQQQDHFAQTLAHTKAEHQEAIKSLNQKHSQDQARAVEQEKSQAETNLKNLQEQFETQISSLELKLEVNHREIANYQQQLTKKQTKIQELQEWSQGQHQRIVELETNLNLLNQQKDTLIKENQDQKSCYENQLQAKDNQLTTEKQTIQQLNNQLARQKTVLEQLLANREEELIPSPNDYNPRIFKVWLETEENRKQNLPSWPQFLAHWTSDPASWNNFVKVSMGLTFSGSYSSSSDEPYRAVFRQFQRKTSIQQELTLIKEILAHD